MIFLKNPLNSSVDEERCALGVVGGVVGGVVEVGICDCNASDEDGENSP